MPYFFEYICMFAAGGLAYGAIEIAYRGSTHWTMLMAGGICMLCIFIMDARSGAPLWCKCIMGGVLITAVEFVFGLIMNVALGWNVWDYSHLQFELMGQISLLSSCAWVALTLPALGVCRVVRRIAGGGASRC